MHCLELSYWHYQSALSWYVHQPESHQLSLQKGVFVSDEQTPGPIDRTPDIPGSDKNTYNGQTCFFDQLFVVIIIFIVRILSLNQKVFCINFAAIN